MASFTDVGIEIPAGRRGEVDTTCPQCSGSRTKSRDRCLSVNTEKGTWFCQHCGWSGGLAEAKGGYGAPLARRTYVRPEPPAIETRDEWGLKYLLDRGIPAEVVARNRITTERVFMSQLDREVDALVFPYYRAGELVNVKYRGPGKTFRMVKDAERILYGLDDCAGAETVVAVEGEMDKLAFEVAGVLACVSVPDGAPPPETTTYSAKFDFLATTDIFQRARRVVIAVDADAPGRRLAEELARRIGPEKCWRVDWPEGCKDANDTLLKFGPFELEWRLEEARPWPVAGIIPITPDLDGKLDDLYDGGLPGGAKTGWRLLDDKYTVRPGLLTVVTGMPSSGKSHLLDALMVNLARLHGWSFGVCSPENRPLERHAAGMIATYVGKPFGDGPTPRMTRDEMHSARAWLARHVTFVLPEEPTIDAILERAKVLVYRHGITGLVVDPWNELDHSRPAGMTETEYVSQCLTQLRNFARDHVLHLWLVAHPTKLQKTSDGEYPVPTPYDVSGSAHFYNKADSCLSVHRDKRDDTAPVQIHVQKIRFAETGQLGVVELSYDTATGRYREPRGIGVMA